MLSHAAHPGLTLRRLSLLALLAVACRGHGASDPTANLAILTISGAEDTVLALAPAMVNTLGASGSTALHYGVGPGVVLLGRRGDASVLALVDQKRLSASGRLPLPQYVLGDVQGLSCGVLFDNAGHTAYFLSFNPKKRAQMVLSSVTLATGKIQDFPVPGDQVKLRLACAFADHIVLSRSSGFALFSCQAKTFTEVAGRRDWASYDTVHVPVPEVGVLALADGHSELVLDAALALVPKGTDLGLLPAGRRVLAAHDLRVDGTSSLLIAHADDSKVSVMAVDPASLVAGPAKRRWDIEIKGRFDDLTSTPDGGVLYLYDHGQHVVSAVERATGAQTALYTAPPSDKYTRVVLLPPLNR